MEEKDLFDGTSSMERLKQKAKLIADCTRIFAGISKNDRVLSRRFKRKASRTLENDFMKGLKQIDKKIPVYIEMPKLESCGNGMFKEVDPKTKEPINNEVHVTPLPSAYESKNLDKTLSSSVSQVIEYNQ